VDDFAFRRGHSYGTILLDLASHQPVDVWEDRRAETFADWLRQHPGVEILSRHRSKDSQRGATDGAPQAQQVIDRWHLLVRRIGACVDTFQRKEGLRAKDL